MAYCSKCGAEIKGNFCSNCGNPINTLSVQQDSSYSNPNVHSVGDFTYTDEDLKFYENKLNTEIQNAEKYVKQGKISFFISLGVIAFTFIHWEITTGFWKAIFTFLIGSVGVIYTIISSGTLQHYSKKLENLKQYNPYSYMMKHKADEEKWRTVGEGIQAFNNGMKIYNAANNIGNFLGKL